MTRPESPWPGTPTLRISRWYAGTRDEVFRAFTDPRLLRQWWGPRGFTIEEIDFPAREGASYRVTLRAPDGTLFAHVGTFLEVRPPAALSYTWRWVEGPLDHAETLVALSFVEERGGVSIDLTHSRFASEAERDKHAGWHDSFAALEGFLDAWRSPGRGDAGGPPPGGQGAEPGRTR